MPAGRETQETGATASPSMLPLCQKFEHNKLKRRIKGMTRKQRERQEDKNEKDRDQSHGWREEEIHIDK